MAQSLSCLSNTIPFLKSPKCYDPYHNNIYKNASFNEFGRARPIGDGVKAMAVDRRDNLDHLQRPGIKRREATAAPLGIWDRFPTARTIQQMMDTMDRIVEDPSAFNSGWQSPLPNNGGGYARGRTPWEIKEGDVEYRMRFDMPGMTKDDVKVWVEEKMLVFKAEKVPKKKVDLENGKVDQDEGDWFAKSYGKYSSRIALPENVDFEKIKAEVKDGVLYITVPKASRTSKILDINVE